MEECPFMEYKTINGREYLYCMLQNNQCGYQKYCPKVEKIIPIERWDCCRLYREELMDGKE